ncbi:MAG: cytochrome c [Gemmatimonadota bacterium]
MGWIIPLAGSVLVGMASAVSAPQRYATLAPATAALAPALTLAAADSPRSVLSGVFTPEQAERGRTVFRDSCGNCHASAQFRGEAFQSRWHGQTIFTIVDQLRLLMPMDNPGGLTADEYTAVIAYVLGLNGYPADSVALPASDSALKHIVFERRPGST